MKNSLFILILVTTITSCSTNHSTEKFNGFWYTTNVSQESAYWMTEEKDKNEVMSALFVEDQFEHKLLYTPTGNGVKYTGYANNGILKSSSNLLTAFYNSDNTLTLEVTDTRNTQIFNLRKLEKKGVKFYNRSGKKFENWLTSKNIAIELNATFTEPFISLYMFDNYVAMSWEDNYFIYPLLNRFDTDEYEQTLSYLDIDGNKQEILILHKSGSDGMSERSYEYDVRLLEWSNDFDLYGGGELGLIKFDN